MQPEKDETEALLFPQILKFGFVSMKEKFALAVYIDPGVLQLCDPFSLQPFIALTIPQTSYSFLDYFSFNENQLIGFNERQLLVIELDHEAKAADDSIFGIKSDLYDELKIQAMQADVRYPKKGLFKRVHTITESIEKYEKENAGKPTSRSATFQQFGKPS